MTIHNPPRANYCAVIVTALRVEYNAVRAHLTAIREEEHSEGDVYERGLFQAGECIWEVGIVEMGMGNSNAAIKTERAIAHFCPEVVLFVGVAGGIKDVTIGDVVVATKVYGYHAGKAAMEFKTRPEVVLPQHRILERARAESRKSNWFARIDSALKSESNVFMGAIAAGEQVVTSSQSETYKFIRDTYNDALAVDMESYGFLKAVQTRSGLEALAVRGISDLIDGKPEADKSGSQERASMHAAAFAFEVLAKLPLLIKTTVAKIREVQEAGSGCHRIKPGQTIKLSEGAVVVQNSPGTQVTITADATAMSLTSEEIGKLIEANRIQASVIERLFSQQYTPLNMKSPFAPTQGSDTSYIPIERQAWPNEYPVKLGPRHKAHQFSGEVFSKPTERAIPRNLAEIIKKLKTADDIAAEIRTQLALWNNDAALLLSERLEKHLRGIEESICPQLLDYLFLMARVYVLCAEKKDPESPTHIVRANGFLTRIDEYLTASPQPVLSADVNALRGSIENIQKGSEAAFKFLAGCDDPYAVRIHLAMYLNKQDVDVAVGLIEGRPPHLRWCDLGVMAYVAAGRRNEALAIVNWGNEQNERSKYAQCIVRLVDASLSRALANHKHGKDLLPQDLSESEQVVVQQALKDLDPILSPIIAVGFIDSKLAAISVRLGWLAHHLLGHRDEVAKLALLLSTFTPVPIDVARSVIIGYITPSLDLPKRLREDYPGDLEANILAVLVESHIGQHTAAYEEAKKLLPLADTNEKKKDLFELFQQLWQELDGDTVTECERIARALVDHHLLLQIMFDVARALRSGESTTVLEDLDKVKDEDNAYWLQLRGNALLQQGRFEEAVAMGAES